MCNYKAKQLQKIIDDVKTNPQDGYNSAKIQITSDGAKTNYLNISPKTLEAIKVLMEKESGVL